MSSSSSSSTSSSLNVNVGVAGGSSNVAQTRAYSAETFVGLLKEGVNSPNGIQVRAPVVNAFGLRNAYIQYPPNSFTKAAFVTTPMNVAVSQRCVAPFAVSKAYQPQAGVGGAAAAMEAKQESTSGKRSFTLNIHAPVLSELAQTLDQWALTQAHTNSMAWFGKQCNLDVLEDKYCKCYRKPGTTKKGTQTGEALVTKVYIQGNNPVEVLINLGGNRFKRGTWQDIRPFDAVDAVVEVSAIWIGNGKFGLTLVATKVRVYPTVQESATFADAQDMEIEGAGPPADTGATSSNPPAGGGDAAAASAPAPAPAAAAVLGAPVASGPVSPVRPAAPAAPLQSAAPAVSAASAKPVWIVPDVEEDQ